ncbi:MAG: xylose isomerase [Phycisphaeraceae bacterium]|nr:xylose isomerase [Phycisphaeraceae bacterium]
MKLGLVTYNLAGDWDADTLIANCLEAGFEGVEPRTTHAHGIEPSLGDAQRAEIRRRFEGAGIAICGLGTVAEYHSDDPAEVARHVEDTKQFVRLAADLGVPGVKVRPNGTNTDKGIPLDQTLEQIGRTAGECAAFAADYGVALRMEVHGLVTCEIPNMKKIADAADHPNFFICWNCNDGETIDGSIRQHFDLLKDRIEHVHIQDLGDPRYPWVELIGLLKGIGYDGWCCAEIQPNPEPVRLMQYYSALWRAYQK